MGLLKIVSVIFVISSFSISANAFHVGLGLFKHMDEVQGGPSAGASKTTDFSPHLSIGHNFWLLDWLKMSPQLGYVQQSSGSDDSYGTYEMRTIYLLYDFLYNPGWGQEFNFRYGIGNFIRQISGDGGTVTVPNGGGFATAYKPGGTSSSYNMSLNLGADYYFFDPTFMDTESFVKWGVQSSFYLFEIIDPDKFAWSYQLSVIGYF